MAEPDGSGGIKQGIKLFLDKMSLNRVAAEAKQAGQMAAKGLADAFSLVKIPPIEPLDPAQHKKILKEYKKDLAGADAEIKRLQMTQQMANTTFTNSGRILNALGVNVYKSSFAFQTLTANVKNVQNGLPMATAGLRAFGNALGGSVLKALKSFAGQLGLTFSVYRLVGFAKSTVSMAAESEAAWARLSSTLSDFGIHLSSVQGDIEKLVASQSKLGVKQQDTVEILATLVQLSGDYQKSLKAVTVVTDLMIARHYTQEQAARAVGRAMIGDNALLSRQGIILDKNRDAIEQLTERMRGELSARAGTLAGKIATVTSAFNDLKISIGEALTQGAGNWATIMIDTMQGMTTWVKQNKEDFGVLAEVIMMTGKAVALVGKGIAGAIKLAESIIGSVDAALRVFGNSMDWLETKLETGFLHIFGFIEKGWNLVTGQHHDAIEKMIKEGQRAADAHKAQAQETVNNWRDALKNLWAPEAGPSGPKAPDFALGTAGRIQAKVQTKFRGEVRQLGNVALHGREDDASAAMERLNKLLQEQETIVSGLSETDDARAKNAGAILDAESNIADIKRIQLAYEKQQNDNAAQRRKDAHDLQEIQRLGRVSREATDPETQRKAMEGLATIQARLTREQAATTKYGERYFTIQNMIDQIENQREQRIATQDKDFKTRIDRLHDQLDLHVDDAAATKELEQIMADLNEEYRKAVTVQDRLRIATKRRMTEQAMMTDNQAREAKVAQLESDLNDPQQRKAAEASLLSIDKQINNEIFKRKTLQMDITDLLALQKRIRQDLSDIEHTSAGELSKELTDARRLSKTWEGRKAAADLYQKVIDDINKQLDGHIKLTEEETAHLKVLLETAQHGLSSLQLITGSLLDEFKQLWEEVGQSFIDNVSTKIADSWTRAAELMLGDLKDIRRGATTAFQGMGKAFAAELKSIATLRAKQHFAEAISEGAEAIKSLANHNFHAAAMHAKGVGHQLLAAAKWAALAGAAGNVGGQGVSGAAAGGSSGNSGNQADNQQNQGPIIYLKIDGMDPSNPKHQELAGMAVEKWQETAHGAQIKLG